MENVESYGSSDRLLGATISSERFVFGWTYAIPSQKT